MNKEYNQINVLSGNKIYEAWRKNPMSCFVPLQRLAQHISYPNKQLANKVPSGYNVATANN